MRLVRGGGTMARLASFALGRLLRRPWARLRPPGTPCPGGR